MPVRGTAVTLRYFAFDTANKVGKTGDVANHTIKIQQDSNTPATPTSSAVEISSTLLPGWYSVDLLTSETNCNTLLLSGKSSTSGIIIQGTQLSFESVPLTVAQIATGIWTDLYTGTDFNNSNYIGKRILDLLASASSMAGANYSLLNGLILTDLDNIISNITTISENQDSILSNLSSITLDAIANIIWGRDIQSGEFGIDGTIGKFILNNLTNIITDINALPAQFPVTQSIITALASTVIDGTFTLMDIWKIMAAICAGKTNGGGTDELVFRNLADTLDRIKFKLDKHNNRIDVTRTLP